MTVSLLIVWEQIARLVFGDVPVRGPEFLPGVKFNLGDMFIPGHSIILVLVTVLVFLLVQLWLTRTTCRPHAEGYRRQSRCGGASRFSGQPEQGHCVCARWRECRNRRCSRFTPRRVSCHRGRILYAERFRRPLPWRCCLSRRCPRRRSCSGGSQDRDRPVPGKRLSGLPRPPGRAPGFCFSASGDSWGQRKPEAARAGRGGTGSYMEEERRSVTGSFGLAGSGEVFSSWRPLFTA